MKCEICNENEATVHISEDLGLAQNVRYLCEQCAEKSLHVNDYQVDNPFDIHTLLKMLAANAEKKEVEVETPECPSCGSTLRSVVDNGLFGCSYCYDYFGEYVPQIVERVQLNQNRHLGKIPHQKVDALRLKRDIESLQQRLDDKVKTQAFEEAAVIRDQIQALKDGESHGE